MSPNNRRALQAVLYEVFAIAFVGPVLSIAFDKPRTSTLALAFVLSSIALTWNYLFNAIFERWESRQPVRGRSFVRRLAHGTGFEGGLAVILVPVMALWLDISALQAFVANLGLLAFFFVYAIAFTWTFDRVFGLPASAIQGDAGEHGNHRPVHLTDSAALITPAMAGAVVVTGSHGGDSAAGFALAVRPFLVVFNDAGRGLGDAGISGLRLLQDAGIAAATVAHTSARIGHAGSTWNEGVISHVNELAAALGIGPGKVCKEALAPLCEPATLQAGMT